MILLVFIIQVILESLIERQEMESGLVVNQMKKITKVVLRVHINLLNILMKKPKSISSIEH
jgi:hypothetical protein